MAAKPILRTAASAIFVASLLTASGSDGHEAEVAKGDFRGLRTSMSRDEAQRAAAANGGRCEDLGAATIAAQTVCVFGDSARAILTFSAKGHITRIHVIFAGDFDEMDMQKYIIQSYNLSPDEFSTGLYKNGSSDKFIFSRMGSDKYSLDIINRDVALKDGATRKAALPKL